MNRSSKSHARLSRREFLGTTAALAAFPIVPRHVIAGSGQRAAGEKMNVGCVGVGGMQGGGDVQSVSSENIYALCDVDENHLKKTAARYPNAKRYRDFREMLDKVQKNLHGITITITDHMHATVALWAMERGIAVYCQKPSRRHFLLGIQWALGDLKNMDATPKGTPKKNRAFRHDNTSLACLDPTPPGDK